jgi:predicted nuclease of predicted toxin-antitoxin system
VQFLADECVWRVVVDALREVGWRGSWIHEVSPSISDRQILELSISENSLIITEDADFGDLVFHEGLPAYGVVRVRLSAFEGRKEQIASTVAKRLLNVGDGLIGRFTTIEPNRNRHRALPTNFVGEK